MPSFTTPLASTPHDHEHCVQHALHCAQTLCTQQKLRLTPLRLRVLELVWQSHKPLGAYDILAILNTHDGRNPAPPTVYRALDFLLKQRLIHRIASKNSFIGCAHPENPQNCLFFLCENCHSAIEVNHNPVQTALNTVAQQLGFHSQQQSIEVLGLCVCCQQSGGLDA